MKEIYSIPSILIVLYNKEQNYILLKWNSFRIPLSKMKEMHKSILNFAIEVGCQCFIADTSTTTSTLSDDIISWWKYEWIDILVRAGIKKIITILPENILAQQSNFEWQQGNYKTIKLYNTTSLERAETINNEN